MSGSFQRLSCWCVLVLPFGVWPKTRPASSGHVILKPPELGGVCTGKEKRAEEGTRGVGELIHDRTRSRALLWGCGVPLLTA